MVHRLVGGVVCALMLSAGLSVGSSGVAQADAVSPAVTGPIPGEPLIEGHADYDMEELGYVQSEFFYEGTADAYGAAETPLTTDGRWTAVSSHQAEYKTRVLVNRPIRDRDFNGTVVVEWFNVSGGVDASPVWRLKSPPMATMAVKNQRWREFI